ncbi:zinc finger BED domain-containing protein RICESLEEPER 3-like [Salvia splendens]|uniref:zinc finger BED domain-containing protein RICESLEEPER 3-like n=1 Tax=Salvia splendens TaxID=180675 RepID=UPI001C26E5D2|nr:zinc finger BED domain-containing protein RICESLEEPER 3-like [Salvia splendens]
MSSVGSSSGRSSSEKRKCKSPQAVPPPKDSTQFEKIADPIAGDLKVICNFCARLFQFRADEKEFDSLKTHFDNKHCTKIRNEASKAEAEAEPQHSSGCAPWYQSYRMVHGCFEYRDALCSFFAEQQFEDVQLNLAQFEACSSFYQLLTTFYQVVEELSHVYQPTSVLVLDNCVKIAVLFNSLMGRDGLARCVAEMLAKWLKYFREIPTVFLLAKAFDPRVRLHGVEKLLEIYYDALFPIKDENTPIPSLIVANVKKCLYDLFQEYSMKHGASSGMNLSSGSHSDEIPLLERLQNLYFDVSEKRPRCYGTNPYGELETYLTARFEYIVEPEFDILKWWSRMTMQFPVMSLIAKGILAAPALTVSVEQAFGTGGYALDWNLSNYLCRRPRSPLVENQLLLGDWTRAEDRNQENDYDNGYMSEEIYDWELDDY